jgi:hypothetical protein
VTRSIEPASIAMHGISVLCISVHGISVHCTSVVRVRALLGAGGS